jgi:hypothetical protein
MSYSKEIRPFDLEELARANRSGGEDAVETYYGWREQRAMAVAKGLGTAAVSILTVWIVPFLKHQYKGASTWLIVVTPVGLIVALALFSLTSLLRMDAIHASFVRATVWLQRFR